MEKNGVKITYRGWPGHFICGSRCQFHLNTLLEYGDEKIVVSTVGLLKLTHEDEKYETINHNRHYETVAFRAKLDKTPHGDFWDADVAQQINFDSEWAWEKPEDEAKAQAGHEKVVQEIADRLVAGNLEEMT